MSKYWTKIYCLNGWDPSFNAAFQGFRKTTVSISFMCEMKHHSFSSVLDNEEDERILYIPKDRL